MKFRNLFLIFFQFFLFFSCSEKTVKSFPENYVFGIIETANRIFSQTRVRVYDENGQVLDSLMVPKAGIYEGFIAPFIDFEHTLYYPIEGTFTKGESGIFKLNLQKKWFKIIDYEYGIRHIVVDDTDLNILFFINYKDQLVKWDQKKNQTLITQDLNKYALGHIKTHQNKIYFFGRLNTIFNQNQEASKLIILNKKNLNIEKIIDISTEGGGHYSSYIDNHYLFFTNNWTLNTSETLNYTLSRLDLNTYEIKNFILPEAYPYQIVHYKNNLIISHGFPPSREGAYFTLFNLEDFSTKLYDVKRQDGFYQIAVQDHYLYALESYNLHKYNIENNFEEVAVYPTKTPFGSAKYPTFANSSFVSAFFLNPKND